MPTNRRAAPALVALLVALALPAAARAEPGPVLSDYPDDDGKALLVEWPAPAAAEPAGTKYDIEIADADAPDRTGPAAKLPAGTRYAEDLPEVYGFGAGRARYAVKIDRAPPAAEGDAAADLTPGRSYVVLLTRIEPDGTRTTLGRSAAAVPKGDLFDTRKINNIVFLLLFGGALVWLTEQARRNPEGMFVRRIPGLEALDEAVGRATEMGRPVFFVHGLAGISSISTVAAVNILGKVGEKIAEYGTAFRVTNRDPVVMAISEETVKESYLRAGRPDLYRDESIVYVSDDQFAYAAAVEGMMVREKPASNLFFGYFFAESLLLTETGAATGAIQIAGTDAYTQLPFFITTCDYTLMGEELYAASAYLSRNPKLLASLKTMDAGKAAILAYLLAGALLTTLGVPFLRNLATVF